MRLDYKKVIPYIEYLSRKVTRLLSGDGTALQIESEEDDKNDK